VIRLLTSSATVQGHKARSKIWGLFENLRGIFTGLNEIESYRVPDVSLGSRLGRHIRAQLVSQQMPREKLFDSSPAISGPRDSVTGAGDHQQFKVFICFDERVDNLHRARVIHI